MAFLEKRNSLCVHNDVTKDNLLDSQNKIKDCIEKATFISLDTEFTGLGHGPSQNTRASNIEERYIALREVVTSHAMVAFGLSIFKEQDAAQATPDSDPQETLYSVDNFNFTLLCQKEYTVNPKSLSFLAESGFDFNKQAVSGIPYFPGEIQEKAKSDKFDGAMRRIFRYLLASKVPVVVHNGLLDVMFLYHGFYACLPKRLDTFLADLSDMFPLGIYDTKYIADYLTREKASFLSYLYRKYEREQLKRKPNPRKRHIAIIHNNIVVDVPARIPKPSHRAGVKHCQQFANHGHCPKGLQCPLSHDLDVILDAEMSKRKRRRKEEATPESNTEPDAISIPDDSCHIASKADSPPSSPASSQSHAAHFDAFMTGFVFARQILTYSQATLREEHVNKIYLIGKSFPLIVAKSAFAHYSESHEAQRQI